MVDENLTKIHLYLAKCLLDCIEDEDLRNIKILLSDKNANPNTILPHEGGSPLHLAIAYDQNESFTYNVVELFLKYGGDPNLRCGEVGLTPVHVAISSEKSKILYLLLKNNGDLFLKDTYGNSALEYAKETENFEWITEIAMLMNSLKDGCDIHEYLQSTMSIISIVDKGQISINEQNSLTKFDKNKTFDINYDKNSTICNKTSNLFNYNYKTRKKSNDEATKNVEEDPIEKTINRKLDDTNFEDIKSIITLDESIYNNNNTYTKKQQSAEDEAFETAESASDNSIKNSQVHDDKSIKQINENALIDEQYTYLLTEDCSDVDNPPLSLSQIPQTICDKKKYDTIYGNYILSPIPFCTSNTAKLTKEQKYTNILSPIPFCTNSDTKKIQSSRILSPISTCITKSTQKGGCTTKNTNNLVNPRNDYKTPMNYIYYNSKTNPEITLDNSFESFLLCKNYDDDDSVISRNSLEDYSKTILAMSEEHKYTDTEQGVELIERRYLTKPLVLPADESGIAPLLSDTNEMTIHLDTDYDTDTLRYNLTQLGYNPGPITHTTKRVYLKKLVELWKFPSRATQQQPPSNQKVYTTELQKTLQDPDWTKNLNEYIQLERKLTDYFENNSEKKLRGGSTKSSFTYLLLDPRVTLNLPLRASTMDPSDLWKTFITSIFYVGKGKRARPYAHLYEAVTAWNTQDTSKKKLSGKIQQIIDIWKARQGVICLHIFQNILPVEAHTREAAMIQVIGVNNLQNLKAGEYYGIALNWRRKEKCLLGVYLLYKAMQIFLNEGERQLRPSDID